jgi:uncharacterized membrane protein YhdT
MGKRVLIFIIFNWFISGYTDDITGQVGFFSLPVWFQVTNQIKTIKFKFKI